ncbi:polyprenol monophosphomannose synthase [Frankia sp. AgB32]|uniref:polyprenol monophosphomannose synthase n=1 Tax=Frankia sp. AgB32 TaxID=631119 RepID=UPI00200CC207|nr:polyprenol monophosphomannose synthase [Frankia sp. AgB32]MCK9893717.1 polyprenol monophosphomannose synthase [Frankia sp. AgB32]
MTSLCVIPTFNEAQTIERVVRSVLTVTDDVDVLVVDDGSPDGTGDIVAGLAAAEPRLHLLRRPVKDGLGGAYRAGFSWGLLRDYDTFAEMDADLSHDPADLPDLLLAARDVDLTIGSRYTDGGSTVGWSRLRRLISRTGNAYVRRALGLPVGDTTAGFRVFRRAVLEDLPVTALTSSGYCFQIETAYLAWRRGYRLAEVPVTFREREAGSSKMSARIIAEALLQVTRWGLAARWDPEPSAPRPMLHAQPARADTSVHGGRVVVPSPARRSVVPVVTGRLAPASGVVTEAPRSHDGAS